MSLAGVLRSIKAASLTDAHPSVQLEIVGKERAQVHLNRAMRFGEAVEAVKNRCRVVHKVDRNRK